MILDDGLDRSLHSMVVAKIKHITKEERECRLLHVKREQNSVSHFLASFGRVEDRTVVWIHSGPGDVPQLCVTEAPIP